MLIYTGQSCGGEFTTTLKEMLVLQIEKESYVEKKLYILYDFFICYIFYLLKVELPFKGGWTNI